MTEEIGRAALENSPDDRQDTQKKLLEPVSASPERNEKPDSWLDILRFVLLTALIVLPIRFFVAQPFLVSGPSMEPSFNDKDYLIVDEISYRFLAPARGEVVVLKRPEEHKYLIKRIIGLPGETLEFNGTSITVKNKDHPAGFALAETYIRNKTDEGAKTVALDQNHYFVMGDNRSASYDSRGWGPLERKNIIGRPIARLYPFGKMAIFPGRESD